MESTWAAVGAARAHLLVGASVLAEETTITTMAKLFAIAFIVVAPFGFVRIRKVLAERRGDVAGEGSIETAEDQPALPDPHSVEAVIAAIGRRESSVELHLPATVDGVAIENDVARILIEDVARRDGVQLVWDRSQASGVWRAEVRPA